MSPAVLAVVPLGISLGIGAWILASMIPSLSRPRLLHRVAPYVVDASAAARDLLSRRPSDPSPLLIGMAAPLGLAVRRALARLLGGDVAISARLRQAGSPVGVDAFRSRQLLWCGVSAALGLAVAGALSRTTALPPAVPVALAAVLAIAGLLAPEQLLSREADARRRRIAAELPTVLEFLTLSLAAGEGLSEAIRRVARAGRGEIAAELATVVAETNAGTSLSAALTEMAQPLALPQLDRLVSQLVAAVERGSPVAEVLRAQAQDARDDARRTLIESAGRKEVAMLVPLVFLILPTTVAFALWPATLVLQLGF